MHAQFECITFDLDDTLWPISPTITAAETELYAWLQKHYSQITEKYSFEELASKQDEFKQRHAKIAHDVTALRLQSLLELAQEFNYPEQLALDAMRYFRTHRNRVIPFTDVEVTLQKLSQHFILGAITNGNAQLEHIGVGRFFSFCVTAEDVGVAKPHAAVFEQAVKLANVDAAKVLHVGDCANADVLGAAKAGLASVWLNPEHKPWPGGQNPFAVIHSLGDLLTLLDIHH